MAVEDTGPVEGLSPEQLAEGKRLWGRTQVENGSVGFSWWLGAHAPALLATAERAGELAEENERLRLVVAATEDRIDRVLSTAFTCSDACGCLDRSLADLRAALHPEEVGP